MGLSNMPPEIVSIILEYLDTGSLWQLCFVSTTFTQNCLEEIQERWYKQRMTIFIGLPNIKWLIKHRKGIWRSICCAAFACLTSKEWELGALRLFSLDYSKLKDFERKETFGFSGYSDSSFAQSCSSCSPPISLQKTQPEHGNNNHASFHSSFSEMPPLIPSISPSLKNSALDNHLSPLIPEKDTIYPFISSSTPIHFSSYHNNIAASDLESINYTSSPINGFTVLSKLQAAYPNPAHNEWKSALTCTMDFHSSFQSPPSTMGSCDIMLRYSERMDIGSFLFWIPSPSGCFLFRLKPTGIATKETPWGSTGLVMWDTSTFGFCNFCNVKLERLQVCGACRVFQYCSRDCQKLDWEKGHPRVCSLVAFNPYFKSHSTSDDDQETEA